MPFIYPHLALMPDAHLGKGATVGSVIPTLGAIIPAAVGVDIGCGMIAVRTQFAAEDLPAGPGAAARADRAGHPAVGRATTTARSRPTAEPRRGAEAGRRRPGSTRPVRRRSGTLQLGSLGSGNHFIEVCARRDGRGLAVPALGLPGRRQQDRAAPHQGRAGSRCERRWIDAAGPRPGLPGGGHPSSTTYIAELRWAQHFALLNREEMMDRVSRPVRTGSAAPVVERETDQLPPQLHRSRRRTSASGVAVAQGRHQGRGGEPGLIPGRWARRRYVVEGLGQPRCP